MYVNVADVTTATYTFIIYTSKASLTTDCDTRHYSSAGLDSHALSHTREYKTIIVWQMTSSIRPAPVGDFVLSVQRTFPTLISKLLRRSKEIAGVSNSQLPSLCPWYPSTVKVKITKVSWYSFGFYLREKKKSFAVPCTAAQILRVLQEFAQSHNLFQRMHNK
jgi:hypothetical protein